MRWGHELTGESFYSFFEFSQTSTCFFSKQTLRKCQEAAFVLLTSAHCYATHYISQNIIISTSVLSRTLVSDFSLYSMVDDEYRSSVPLLTKLRPLLGVL